MRDVSDALVVVIGLVVGLFFVGPLLLMVLAMPTIGMMGAVPGRGPWPLLVGAGVAVLYLGGAALVARWLIGNSQDDALEELRLALARGEITEEEYERRRELLERDRE